MNDSWSYSQVEYKEPSFVLNIEKRLPVENNVSFTPGNSLILNYTSQPAGNWLVTLNYPEWRGKDHFERADFLSFWIFLRGTKKKYLE